MCYPKSLGSDFLKLRIMTLEDERMIERRIAKQYGYTFPIDFLEAGQRYTLSN
jgi:hypothetical protein